MKRIIIIFSCLFLLGIQAWAQPATVSYPFSVGRTGTCNSGSSEIHFYTYNGATNTIANASGGQVAPCTPRLRIGTSGGGGGSERFTSSLASVSFNPRDKNVYYLWTDLGASPVRTYAWRYPVGTCPAPTGARLDTIRSFRADILGVAFDNNGNGYILEFTNEPSGVPHKAMIRSINFTTGVMGGADTMALTGGARIYETGSGDVAMSPSGQMFFVVNNKLFTPNYSAYTGTGANITCTYIDTVRTSNNFVGLTFAEGETIAAYSGGGCPYEEIIPLTAVNSPITKNNTPTNVKSTSDLATVITGIGAAKSLVSVTPTGTANQYNVVYDIVVKNYGNTDVTNIQVTDNLAAINGLLNVSNINVTIPVNPNGYTVNPLFNGSTFQNLLSGSPTLPNYPVANSSFTIRITCRLSGILSGVPYYNSAIATGVGFNNNDLRDVSTNGTNPDLNGNDKPDDTGENQPTPLLITVPAITPPCGTLTNILFSQNFGTGTGLTNIMPAPALGTGATATNTTLYGGSVTAPLPIERFTITNNPFSADAGHFITMADHTGNANGRMLLINADAANTIMYRANLNAITCENQQYSLSFWAAFPGSAAYATICNGFGGTRYPRIRMRIRDGVSGLIVTEISTPDITSSTWQQYGLRFLAPISYTNLQIELLNDAPGGCGNDVVIDDIEFGNCDPTPTVSASLTSGCMGAPATFTANVADPSAIGGTTQYQWQYGPSATGPWTNIGSSNAAIYNIPSVAAADTGRYYRVIVASTTTNLLLNNCRFISPAMILRGRLLSTPATSASANKTNVCPLIQVTLSVTGGSLGDGAQWVWYANSCSGTPVGTGASITIAAPSFTTTYYVRAEGLCNTTICRSVTLTISCNIDKDRDGIPDYVESYAFPTSLFVATNTSYPGYKDFNNDHINDDFQADGDSDNDGIPNYLDTDFPGRVDSNGDGVDDRFDSDLDGIINMLDLDSDNDGIPDVVEAGGVDANGDGRIDNYSDSDGDGLSQNVDASNIGVLNSGIGLGAPDSDGDGIPNAIDLDSDNDGIPDVVEAGGPDANNDGRIDGFVDANNDGLHDSYINATGLLRTGADTNNDGRADSYPFKNFDNDRRANPYDLDSDGDGITDVREAGFADTNYNGMVDGTIGTDGWSTVIRARASLGLLNTDGVGQPNYLDIDSDGDGIPDNIEGQRTEDYVFPTGLDNDGDGLDNAYDLAPHHATFGGAGILLSDRDGDNIPDYMDLDTDADGQPDIREGHDWNLNGDADEIVTPTGVDTDGDGLDDRFDLINSTTNVKGTSIMMGALGSLTGDASPGTRAMVQRSASSGCTFERDWRCVTGVLPVKYLKLFASENKGLVSLNWDIISNLYLSGFEIERSTDNANYQKINNQSADIVIDKLKNFSNSDNIETINASVVYYRIKVTAVNGQIKYSNVVAIRKDKAMLPFTVTPNPASDIATVRYYSDKETMITLSIHDYTGKLVYLQKQKAGRGNNVFPLINLAKYANGVYQVQMLIDNDVQSAKLVIRN